MQKFIISFLLLTVVSCVSSHRTTSSSSSLIGDSLATSVKIVAEARNSLSINKKATVEDSTYVQIWSVGQNNVKTFITEHIEEFLNKDGEKRTVTNRAIHSQENILNGGWHNSGSLTRMNDTTKLLSLSKVNETIKQDESHNSITKTETKEKESNLSDTLTIKSFAFLCLLPYVLFLVLYLIYVFLTRRKNG